MVCSSIHVLLYLCLKYSLKPSCKRVKILHFCQDFFSNNKNWLGLSVRMKHEYFGYDRRNVKKLTQVTMRNREKQNSHCRTVHTSVCHKKASTIHALFLTAFETLWEKAKIVVKMAHVVVKDQNQTDSKQNLILRHICEKGA